ncbi:MAG: polysaccharide deacetylase family protein [Oscillospiraceae bacterium]|nr:polysaccharide deacetylase family protein [Oscillospiraceae bacterium]
MNRKKQAQPLQTEQPFKKKKKKHCRAKAKKTRIWAIIVPVVVFYLALCVAGVFIVDRCHPEITLLGEENVVLEYGESYTDPGVQAIVTGNLFGDRSTPPQVTCTNETDLSRLGTGTITYTASWKKQSVSVQRTITVVDTTAPQITLLTREGYSASWFNKYEEEGFTAADNYDGDLTAFVQREQYDDRVVYSVHDSSGNECTVERPIVYSITAPEITLLGGEHLTLQADRYYSDPGYSAHDDQGSDLTSLVQVSGQVTPWLPGTYELTYTISNTQGGEVTALRTVEVVGAEVPQTVRPSQKTIYLTFDDGPGPYTDALLDVLKAYRVKATFFITGNDSDYENCIGRAYREGHSIAVHTLHHDYATIYSSEEAFFDDFFAAQEIIKRQTGDYTRLFRFPGGSSNTISRKYNTGIMGRLAKAMTAMGYKYYDWDIDSGDAANARKANDVYNNVTNGILADGGTAFVILQHDIKDYSVNAVEKIIIWGQSNGYRFAALDINSYAAHHGINN